MQSNSAQVIAMTSMETFVHLVMMKKVLKPEPFQKHKAKGDKIYTHCGLPH